MGASVPKYRKREQTAVRRRLAAVETGEDGLAADR